MATQSQEGNDEKGELLVSEFPPPPFYYQEYSSLSPPLIPRKCFELASEKATFVAKAAAAATERLRLMSVTSTAEEQAAEINALQLQTLSEFKEGEVVAVFGEIVEDPTLAHVEDICEDPTTVRDTIYRLNKEVTHGFVTLVNELVHRPLDNKKCRDELSHNLFLMLKECNKYREHQAREILIETLEKQLMCREEAKTELKEQISKATQALKVVKQFRK